MKWIKGVSQNWSGVLLMVWSKLFNHVRYIPLFDSEEAAKESLIYVYKSAATGFSAKLTPEQVSELESKFFALSLIITRSVK